jgi:ABC-2 type transport system permease protein
MNGTMHGGHAIDERMRSRVSFPLFWVVSDTWELVRRSLRHITREPDQLASVTVQPIVTILMLRYIFGGAISTAGQGTYIDFLMGGIFIWTSAFSALTTSIAVATDTQEGIVERFKSLPMAKSAVITGHVVADLFRCLVGVAVCVGLGFLVGFRPHTGLTGWLIAVGITLLVTFALSWVSAILGLLGRTVEAVQQFGLALILPVLVSSAFAPTSSMPHWLQVFADNQPVTHAIDSVRASLLGEPLGDHVLLTVVWFVGIIVIAAPTATFLFRRRAS